MHLKREQFVPHGAGVIMAFPGGTGYGAPAERPLDLVKRDLVRGYISDKTAAEAQGRSAEEIAAIHQAVAKGETL